MRTLTFFFLLLSLLFITCSKNGDKTVNRELSPLGKKLIGKWYLVNLNPSPGDFWEFRDFIIDSLNTDSTTYRQYVDSVKQSFCSRLGKWFLKDSILIGTCVPDARIIKLTDDTLIFRYGAFADYIWKRAK